MSRPYTIAEKRQRERDALARLSALQSDPLPNRRGVLLSRDILYYVRKSNLISRDQFSYDCLKPAAYELRIGNEWYANKCFHNAEDEKLNSITINPFEVAVIQTLERVCIPRFLIARWNIRVKWAYKGLFWVGGPQVDPGYKGHLFCPIYNMSDRPVVLEIGEPIAVIDFVKTTIINNLHIGKKPWHRYPEPKRVILQDFGIEEFER